MKKLFLGIITLCFTVSLAFAQETAPTNISETVTLKGYIIDNMCASAHKGNLADFVKNHTKECTLMPQCVASGYSIFADGKLYKFDQASNVTIEYFLKKKDSKVQVVVVAKKAGEELSLLSIENQK